MPVTGDDRLDGGVPGHVGHRVDVHVPQAGNKVGACSLDHLCTVGYPHLAGPAGRYDAVACDENRLFGAERPIRHIDDGGTLDDHGRRTRPGAGTQEHEQSGQDVSHSRLSTTTISLRSPCVDELRRQIPSLL